MKKFALVQLIPKDMRNQESINLGFEIVKNIIKKKGWQVDTYKFGDNIENINTYDIIGFSIFYFTQMLNLIPFLRYNNIEPLCEKRNRKPLLIAGGQGIQNPKPISKFIDVFCMGEAEGVLEYILDNYKDIHILSKNKYLYIPSISEKINFNTSTEIINSEPVIYNKNAMIELTRGCKYRCKFCQYGWTNGKYREKDIELVKQQILYIKNKGIKNINLLSCNLGGYSKINEVLDFCIKEKIRLMNTDMRINEYTEEIAEKLNILKVRTLKVGIESFSEKTRFGVNKNISNNQLNTFIDRALKHNISNLHFYLIYGLPNERNYDEWFFYMKYIKDKIKTVNRNIRVEFSITNFEPAIYTPFEKSSFIDFNDKHEFIRKYLIKQEELGYIKQPARTKDYKNSHGRLGRKERSYNIGMWLLHGNETIGDILYELNINGIGRSIKDNVYDKIYTLCKSKPYVYQIMDIQNKNENIWN